jgi:N-acetylmuramic acid 6-phosphate (MurNAc-6-P) etherase
LGSPEFSKGKVSTFLSSSSNRKFSHKLGILLGMKELSRSELPHSASQGLDRMEPDEMVDLFHACDLEAVDALLAPNFLKSLGNLGKRLLKGSSPLVIAGAGTSGRLAYLLVERHWEALRELGISMVPWIAGGAKALCLPVEGAEDDSLGAKKSIAALLGRNGFYLGISCGLSAPAVAGGMAAALEADLGVAVFGTNEVSLARKDPFPGLSQGFFGVLKEAEGRGDSFLLTPDTGPEPLTGSSRMKGGTATWLALDVLFEALVSRELGVDSLEERIRGRKNLIVKSFTSHKETLVGSLRMAGKALREGGQVLYLGRGEAGLAGVLDASECPPTFGADPDQVRAYLDEGWAAFRFLDDLERDRLRASLPLSPKGLAIRGDGRPVLALLMGGGQSCNSLKEKSPDENFQTVLLKTRDLLSTKLFLNALSTGAFVLAGKVYQNRMIDLQLSNSKLFQRAQRIVVDLVGVPQGEAFRALVGAIHGVFPPPVDLLRIPIEAHLQVSGTRVVPTAVLLAKGLELGEAKRRLDQEPRLRRLMEIP